jgi:benzaldehyde dehydrogenase (NAD)
MGLLDGVAWQGRVINGEWSPAAATQPVVEPATGDELGTLGLASAEQVGAAADRAAAAQREWAAAPYLETPTPPGETQ